MNKIPMLRISYELMTNCPSCDEDINVLEQDFDGCFTDPIFTNDWDNTKDHEVYCKECDGYFKHGGVEY
tara:strand:- start:779 stop:985 length:207 start_codon:yes stop_codon:yes gene_type:complete